MDTETEIERRWDLEKEIEKRGRVRDISGQYHRQALTTKILASLNRRSTFTEWGFFFFLLSLFLCHTSASQIVENGSSIFPFHFLDLGMKCNFNWVFFFFFGCWMGLDLICFLFFVLGFWVFCHRIESSIKDKEKRIETETNHPPSIQSDHRNHRHIKIHLDLLSSL